MISGGYAGRMLRVDLNSGTLTTETYDEATLRKYLGGVALAARILYEEVLPEVKWDDPENRLVLATGPLTGTRVMGSGTFSVTTKGAMTGGATSTQANGFLGAYMKFSGFDGVIVQGKVDGPVYLYLHDGVAELRDASYLKGKGTREVETLVNRELGTKGHDISVFSIGPAGENLVRFAGIIGDYGHSASHNGVGAVMGAKGLKAVVAARGRKGVPVADRERLAAAVEEAFQRLQTVPALKRDFDWGTSTLLLGNTKTGLLAVKNYTTNLVPDCEKFDGTYYRAQYETRPHRCWTCRTHHTHFLKVTEGPYTGYEGKEPEYEQWASWGPLIGQMDPGAAVVLSNECNDLGMDCNEGSWLTAMLMELYEKGVLTSKDTGGLDLTWGNTEAVRELLRRIAHRQGFGGVVSGGVKRTAQALGKEALECGIYNEKGNTSRTHDDRAGWRWMFDQVVSSTGTSQSGGTPRPVPSWIRAAAAAQAGQDPFSIEAVTEGMVRDKGIVQVEDSLATCRRCLPDRMEIVVEMLNAVTGWDLTEEEVLKVGLRALHLMKVYNLRQGIGATLDAPSKRLSSAPVDGPVRGKSIAPLWEEMLHTYYEKMGWDRETGKPLPETLRSLGLEDVIGDIW
ncbi:MAG: hypothetical protein HYX92_12005 [Chloroflexi bacterium]|nr:hypothetical protein [Chloroflexota bacterium]